MEPAAEMCSTKCSMLMMRAKREATPVVVEVRTELAMMMHPLMGSKTTDELESWHLVTGSIDQGSEREEEGSVHAKEDDATHALRRS